MDSLVSQYLPLLAALVAVTVFLIRGEGQIKHLAARQTDLKEQIDDTKKAQDATARQVQGLDSAMQNMAGKQETAKGQMEEFRAALAASRQRSQEQEVMLARIDESLSAIKLTLDRLVETVAKRG